MRYGRDEGGEGLSEICSGFLTNLAPCHPVSPGTESEENSMLRSSVLDVRKVQLTSDITNVANHGGSRPAA